MSVYIKTERSQINNIMVNLKHLEKQEQAIPQTSRRRQITKVRDIVNEIEVEKKIYKEELMKQEVGSSKR
jgi:hypothetical protein